MVAFSDNGLGSFIDLTSFLKTRSGSTAGIFQGTGSGNVFYLGNLTRRFPGMKPQIVTPMVWGSGTGVWEFSTGAGGWQAFDVMHREDRGDGTSYGQEVFIHDSASKPTKVNFCTIAENPAWVTDSVNGQTAYWVRFRLTGAITTVPIMERIKLAVNNVEIDNTGIQFAGLARPLRTFFVHLSLADDLAGASPSNETLAFSSNIRVTPIDNEFVDGNNDGLGGIINIPKGLDTSSPITFRVGWAPSNNNSGTIDFKLYVASPINVGSNIDSSAIPEVLYEDTWDTLRPSGSNQSSAVPSVESTTQDQQYVSEITFSIPDSLPGTSFAYALRRNDNSDPDSYAGNAKISFIQMEGRFWHL